MLRVIHWNLTVVTLNVSPFGLHFYCIIAKVVFSLRICLRKFFFPQKSVFIQVTFSVSPSLRLSCSTLHKMFGSLLLVY